MAVTRLYRVGDGFFKGIAYVVSSSFDGYSWWRRTRQCKKQDHELVRTWNGSLCVRCGEQFFD